MVRSQREPVAHTLVQNSTDLPDCPLDGSVIRSLCRGCTGLPLGRLERSQKTISKSLPVPLPLPPVPSAWAECSEGHLHCTGGTHMPTAGTLLDSLSWYVPVPAQRLGYCCSGNSQWKWNRRLYIYFFFQLFLLQSSPEVLGTACSPVVCFGHPLPVISLFLASLFFLVFQKIKYCINIVFIITATSGTCTVAPSARNALCSPGMFCVLYFNCFSFLIILPEKLGSLRDCCYLCLLVNNLQALLFLPSCLRSGHAYLQLETPWG